MRVSIRREQVVGAALRALAHIGERPVVDRHEGGVGAGVVGAGEQRLPLVETQLRDRRSLELDAALRQCIAGREIADQDLSQVAQQHSRRQAAGESDAGGFRHQHPVLVGDLGHDHLGRHRDVERPERADACDVRLVGENQEPRPREAFLGQDQMTQTRSGAEEILDAVAEGVVLHFPVAEVVRRAHRGRRGVVDHHDHLVGTRDPVDPDLLHHALALLPRKFLAAGVIRRHVDIGAGLDRRTSGGARDDLLRDSLAHGLRLSPPGYWRS